MNDNVITQTKQQEGIDMKVLKAFAGTDTYGRHVERAQSVSGKWFSRSRGSSEWGMVWSKWLETEEPEVQTTTTNAYSGEVTECDPVVLWGWSKMIELDVELPRWRLPA